MVWWRSCKTGMLKKGLPLSAGSWSSCASHPHESPATWATLASPANRARGPSCSPPLRPLRSPGVTGVRKLLAQNWLCEARVIRVLRLRHSRHGRRWPGTILCQDGVVHLTHAQRHWRPLNIRHIGSIIVQPKDIGTKVTAPRAPKRQVHKSAQGNEQRARNNMEGRSKAIYNK